MKSTYFPKFQFKRRNTLHGSTLTTVKHEYDRNRLSYHSDGCGSTKGRRKISSGSIVPSEGVTALMVSCQQELEHDVHTILLKKVRESPFF